MKIKLFILLILLNILHHSSAQWSEIQKILPSISPVNDADWYGNSIAIEDGIIVVGAPYHDNAKGCAYVLQDNAGALETIAILSAQNPVEGDGIGYSVDIFGSTIVVGALGKVLIFNKPESGWQDMTESSIIIPPENSSSYFGAGVSIEEQTLVIGAYTDDLVLGKVFIYDNNSGSWTKKATLTSTDSTFEDRFGEKVCISGNTVITGASLDTYSGSYPGSAYVFEKPTSGWEDMTQTAKLTCTDEANENSSLGSSVSIYNNTILVGAEYATRYGKIIGSAYLYEKPEAGWSNMTQTAILDVSESTSIEVEQFFGGSVALYDNIAIVGAHWDGRNGEYSGSVYVYNKPQTGWENMIESEVLLPGDGSIRDEFGCYVAMDNNKIIVGAIGAGIESDELTDAGAVYFFKNTELTTNTLSGINLSKPHVFPNPTKSLVYIKTSKNVTNLRLYSSNGNLLFKKDICKHNSIDLSSFNNGCYLLLYQIQDITYREIVVKY